jgi:hypothetical protein
MTEPRQFERPDLPEPLIGMIGELMTSDNAIAAAVGLRLERIYDALTDLADDVLRATDGK